MVSQANERFSICRALGQTNGQKNKRTKEQKNKRTKEQKNKGFDMELEGWGIRVKRRIQRFIYWALIDNLLVRPFRLPIVTISVPILAGAYLTLQELFFEKWSIFYYHPNVHMYLTLFVIGVTVLVAVMRGLAESYLEAKETTFSTRLQLITRMSSEIVLKKLARFKAAAATAETTEDMFLKITRPGDQLNVILSEAKNFLLHSFTISSEDHIRITIMEPIDIDRNLWCFSYDTQPGWEAEEAKIQLRDKSVAQQCIATGEPQYYQDKALAAVERQYKISARDERLGNGSIYCYPVSINIRDARVVNVVAITTYGGCKLCGNYNDGEILQVNMLLKEICRRIELELTLRALRNWKTSSNINEEGV